MINRIVLIKFSKDTTVEQLQEVIKRFKSLKEDLVGIVEIHAGLNLQEKSKEYQVVLSVRFEDQAALEAYVADAKHQAVAAYIKEVGRVDSIGVDFDM
jgi:hypothetical protein